MGFRFRLQRKDLPGRPDVTLAKYKTVVFVHGCFWHRHQGCKKTTTPATRVEFWQEKFRKNVERDARNQQDLTHQGWNVVIVWECELRDEAALAHRLECELRGDVEEAGELVAEPIETYGEGPTEGSSHS